ncbi:UDP-2,3-diacylglucosamine diphosphatase, partial [Salmonella enterica]
IRIYFMHGNRDFLAGEAFAAAAGLTILPDPSLLTLYCKQVLLSHGDALCTDDVAYQAFRQQVRTPAWQQAFLQ